MQIDGVNVKEAIEYYRKKELEPGKINGEKFNISSGISSRIINGELITKWFGFWHDFHDFEVIHVEIDRNRPIVVIQIYGFLMLSEVDEKGYYKLTKHCVITLKFDKVSDLSFEELIPINLSSVTQILEKSEFKSLNETVDLYFN